MKLKIIFFLLSILSFSTYSQNDWCASDEELEAYLNESPSNRAKYEFQQEEINRLIKEAEYDKNGHVKVIPVVVHVMHYKGDGNISKEQIEDGIRILNEDFQLLNADTTNIRSIFKPHKANFEVEFRLAKIDPFGNCTEGITRQSTMETYSVPNRNDIKDNAYWDARKYFNVWLVNSINSNSSSGTVLGYAQFPGTGPLATFGIVCRNDEWGSIGTAVGSNGRTVTHEVGHCFNLLHTFQSGCGNYSCTSSGDRVCDTPPSSAASFGCTLSNNSCSIDSLQNGSAYSSNVPDMLENYMSYDDCQYMFTIGQKSRSLAALNYFSELKDLFTSSNLLATGTDDAYIPQLCAPIALIIRERIYACVGSAISFYENSYNGKISNWEWSFPGATPSSSTDSLPIIHYNNAGVYSYSLKISNATGADSISISNAIYISDTVAQYSAYNYSESFESATQFSKDWIVEDKTGRAKWELTNNASYVGSSSVWINNNSLNTEGEIDDLISPSFDFTTIINPVMKFQVAYKKRDINSSDRLSIFTSIDCGNSWILRYSAPTYLLQAGSNQSFNFVPQTAADWKEIYMPIPSNLRNKSNVRFKFSFEAGGGNNIYMDNLRFEGKPATTNIQENEFVSFMNIYPNPANAQFTIQLELAKQENVKIELRDLLGKTIKLVTQQRLNKNNYKFNVDTESLSAGIYLVETIIGTKRIVKKVVVK